MVSGIEEPEKEVCDWTLESLSNHSKSEDEKEAVTEDFWMGDEDWGDEGFLDVEMMGPGGTQFDDPNGSETFSFSPPGPGPFGF